MVDFFEEVEEDLRADRLRRLTRTYLPWAIAATVAGVAVFGGYWGWTSWRTHAANEASISLDKGMRALQAGDKAGADAAFTAAAKAGSPAYKALALMQRAGVAVSENRTDDAVKLLDEAAKADTSGKHLIGDQAAYKAVLLLMDKAPYSEIETRLKPLVAEGRPYRLLALEAQAMAQLQAGKTKDARANFQLIGSTLGVSDEMRQRSQIAVDVIDSGAAAPLQDIIKAAGAAQSAQPAGLNPFASSAGSPAPQAGAAPQ